jgi:inhibitor of cysteine peptidase
MIKFKIFFLSIALLTIWLFDIKTVFAVVEDNSLMDMDTTNQKTNETFTFTNFTSCQDFESVMKEFVIMLHKNQRFWWYRGWFLDDINTASIAEWWSQVPQWAFLADAKTSNAWTAPSTNEAFSNTNTQKVWVDEPEIIKTDGKYIYYYSSADYNKSKNGKIAILEAPAWTKNADLSQAKIIKNINLPQSFQQVQMFLQNNKMIIVAQRYLNNAMPYESYFIDKNTKTTVIVYDITDPSKSKVLKIMDYDGNYVDARIVNNTLIVASQIWLNRWPIYPLIAKDGSLDITKLDTTLSKVVPVWLSIDYTTDSTLKNIKKNNKIINYHGKTIEPNCKDIMYLLPSEETIKKHHINPEFGILHTIDLSDVEKKPETKVLFGSTSQIHVSTKWIYLANPLYLWGSSWSCPVNAMCLMRMFPQNENTLIHKFTIGSKLSYVNSVIVPWQPLNQYSMDEDKDGKFRILTKTRSPSLSTHLFILDDKLNALWSLKDIEPGEEFKASRYIWDKLYLVTFKQIDPLFVIDMINSNNPKIIWELKIPGFSTYLHPYSPISQGIQYLIGLWYDTSINQRWWETTNGIKIDLYKVDYNTLNASGMINVKQIASQTLWSKGSYSPALENPRTFVWDESKKQLILPLILSYEKQTQQCNIQYDTDGKELNKQCYPMTSTISSFAGIKGLAIDINKGISENISVDYLDKLKTKYPSQYGGFQYYNFNEIGPRVGYIGNTYYFFNRYFGHFFNTTDLQGKNIDIR